ncbi:helix-turn-helix domain-containing protein [Roseovarius sp.]|uniref:TetR/AcrR family transcriptional regulator n=1 Tax=Roseovarius sp. TaxID=1486281 RepID=UPI003B59BE1D
MSQDETTLRLARHAATLFLERGVSATTGDDIAQAAGVSKRTVWRHFRTKETCVAPLFFRSSLQFACHLRDWPTDRALEPHLQICLAPENQSAQDFADGILVARLLAILPGEPDLRASWLLACHEGEVHMRDVIAFRLDRSANEFEIRLCAALVSAAVRIVDETISVAAIDHGQVLSAEEVIERLANAIRTASTLPFCDPVTPDPFGDRRTMVTEASR